MVAGAAKTEAATAAVGDGKSMVTGKREAVRAEVEEEMEAVVPPELGAASQAPAVCNHATYRAPRE